MTPTRHSSKRPRVTSPELTADLSRRDQLSRVRIGKKSAYFSVEVAGIRIGNLADVLKPLALSVPNDVITAVLYSKNEKVLGRAMVEIANALLPNQGRGKARQEGL